MKIFQEIQKNLSYFGINVHHSFQNYPINARNTLVFFIFSVGLVMHCMYVCNVAASFKEYSESAFSSVAAIDTIVIFTIVVWRMNGLFDYFDRVEKVINESEFNSFHSL